MFVCLWIDRGAALVCCCWGGLCRRNNCHGSDLCFAYECVCVCERVHVCVHVCFEWHSPWRDLSAIEDPCIIVHQPYTKLMTRGYVGQAGMMQQTRTEGHWQTMGDRRGEAEKDRTKQRVVRRNAAGESDGWSSKTRRWRERSRGRRMRTALDVRVPVVEYHPFVFAHHTRHLCVVLVFVSELITGRRRQLPDQ